VRILLAGDLHANLAAGRETVCRAVDARADVIVQLGDFGFWPGRDHGFLAGMDSLLRDSGMQMWWLDGNHEDHPALLQRGADGFGNLVHLPRGHTWTWEGVTWAAVGGAVSVDAVLRVPGVDWFPQESAVPGMSGHADVVVAHDAPLVGTLAGLDVPIDVQARQTGWARADIAASRQHMREMGRLCRELSPAVWFHGHHHVRHTGSFGQTRIEGLAADGKPGSMLLVDAAGMTIDESPL